MIFDRTKDSCSSFFDFKAPDSCIQAISFGPYDNGHVVVGLDCGMFTILDSTTLSKLFQVDSLFTSHQSIARIVFDPTNLIVVTGLDGEVAVVSMLEHRVGYTYLDLGQNKFCTVHVNDDNAAS
jgi:hypothetical protein